MEKYTLWFMPSGKSYDKLKSIISDLSKELKSPLFEPHITLLGDIPMDKEQVILRTGQLAQLIKPFEISLKKIGVDDEYFRCVFAVADKTSELMKANDIARRFFYMDDCKKPFMPHLSLIYGKFDQMTKEKIIKKLDFNQSFKIESVFITDSSKEKKINDWKIIKEVMFR